MVGLFGLARISFLAYTETIECCEYGCSHRLYLTRESPVKMNDYLFLLLDKARGGEEAETAPAPPFCGLLLTFVVISRLDEDFVSDLDARLFAFGDRLFVFDDFGGQHGDDVGILHDIEVDAVFVAE